MELRAIVFICVRMCRWGDHYWKAEFLMDCSQTESGWFELKGYATGGVGWERDVTQGTCTGTVGGTKPYVTINHMARCGHQNVFEWGAGACIINAL